MMHTVRMYVLGVVYVCTYVCTWSDILYMHTHIEQYTVCTYVLRMRKLLAYVVTMLCAEYWL